MLKKLRLNTKRLILLYRESPIQARIFLTVAIPFCLLLVFVSPPMQAADESQHYLRAYGIAHLNFNTTQLPNGRYGSRVPANVAMFVTESTAGRAPYAKGNIGTIKKYLKETEGGNATSVYYENTAINFPLAYVPQSIGIAIGHAFNLPLLYGFYIGRLLNALIFIILVFLALRITPFARWSFLAVSLLPMTIYQASSLSSDALLISLSFIVTALLLKAYSVKRIDKKHIALIGALILALAITKQVYLLFALPILLIPTEKFDSKKAKYICFVAIILLSGILALSWNISVNEIANTLHTVYRPDQHIIPSDRVLQVIANPFSVIVETFKTLLYYSSLFLTESMIGIVGWLDIPLPAFCYFLLFTLIVVSVLKDGSEKPLISKRLRIVLLISALLMILGTCILLYIGYTANNDAYINGLQGRYFIPMLLFILPVFITKKISIQAKDKIFVWIFGSTVALSLLCLLFVVLDANYLNILFK